MGLENCVQSYDNANDSNVNAVLLAILSHIDYLFQKRYNKSATALTNFKIYNLKILKESLLQISRSSFFHSVIVEGKN